MGNGPLCQERKEGIFSPTYTRSKLYFFFSSKYKVSKLNVLEHNSLKELISIRTSKLSFKKHHKLKEEESE